MSGYSRSSISDTVMRMIQDIKEIAGNHSEEEIHAMLKDCSMEPNEAAQKLLLQDPFHEVRRKRDKRKENLNNRESADSKWRTGTQGRGGRGGRGNYPPRNTSHDAGDGRNATAGKANGVNQGPEKGVTPSSLSAPRETEIKAMASVSSSLSGMANGPTNVAHGSSTRGRASEYPAHSDGNPLKEFAAFDADNLGSELLPPPPPVVAKNTPSSEVNIMHEQPTPSSDRLASPVSVLGVYSSASDPVLVPSLDSRLPGMVGTIKREVGSQRSGVESNSSIPAESKSISTQDFANHLQMNKVVSRDVTNSEISSSMNEKAYPDIGKSFMHGKMQSKSQAFERNQGLESSQPSSSSIHVVTSTSRPSSNYGSRSQQLTGSQKAVGPNKEWKPKSTITNSAPASGIVGTSEVGSVTFETGTCSLPTLNVPVSEETTSKLQQKLDELHLSHSQHVIIPNHLQVPEAERTRLSFGSFDASFGVKRSYANDPDTDKSSTPLSDSSQEIEEIAEEPYSSNRNESPTAQEGNYSEHPHSPQNVSENQSPVEVDVSSSAAHEYDQSKPETVASLEGPEYSVIHTAPSYNIGVPPILGTQFAPFDSSEPQAREVSPLPSFVVQQPFDPSSSYYTQFYRPSVDGDGRFSPCLAPGAAPKYNGNVAVLSPQSGQPQESGNSLVLSTAGATPLATQAAGVMQSSLAVPQQSFPVFRQPSGVHLPHFPNYFSYNQYLPYYIPPTIQHFVNTPYLPQPPAGSVYPPPAAAAATGVKYSLSQYKPVTNAGNSGHVGIPSGYAPYSNSPTAYSPSPAVTSGNSTGNEDLSASQYKENNVYLTGQQSEGSAVWIPAPGRDISGLQPTSFYNLSPQGQHVTFTPTQAGHGGFPGIYHPTQTMAAASVHPLLQQSQTMAGAVEMVGPPSGVYQQPQRAQVNWPNNY